MIGEKLVRLRKARGMSTNKLANLSGISQSYLREIEMCQKNPTVEVLSYLCGALGISLSEFFSEEEKEINSFLFSAIKKLSNEEQLKLADFINQIKPDIK